MIKGSLADQLYMVSFIDTNIPTALAFYPVYGPMEYRLFHGCDSRLLVKIPLNLPAIAVCAGTVAPLGTRRWHLPAIANKQSQCNT